MKKRDDAETTHTISLDSFLADDPVVKAFLEQRARFLDSLSPEERTREEARFAAEEEAAEQRAQDDERAYNEAVRAAEVARERQHQQIALDRRTGVVGTLTEIGRPHGLCAIKVGRILDGHGLREIVDVHVPTDDPHCDKSISLRLVRGVRDGYAVRDPFDGRVYWIVAKVSSLLAEASRR